MVAYFWGFIVGPQNNAKMGFYRGVQLGLTVQSIKYNISNSMDNLIYSASGLNIISNIPNEIVRFNCKNAAGATITGMNVYNNVAQLYVPISLGSGSNPTVSSHRGFPTANAFRIG